MNERNLISPEELNSRRSPEKHSEDSRKGGIASGEARRRKRDMREAAKTLLEMPVSQSLEKIRKSISRLGFEEDSIDYSTAVLTAQMMKALKGDSNAAKFLRDTAGFNPAFQLQEQQFKYEQDQKNGQGVEIEDISRTVIDIWGYETWSKILRDGIPVHLEQTVFYQFSQIHIEHIRACKNNMYNILEGAVRSGKTVDNILAFAMELCNAPDKFHLATGSTLANAKLNIGDANGFGLEHIFRGQCRWSKYKNNDALIVRGPYTGFEERVVIFAGCEKANAFKRIRGNSYGMWIATEINLHHDTAIEEAFNRSLAAKKRKIFWDLNPEHPKAAIYVKYIDKYVLKSAAGELSGGCNYHHCTIFDNVTITEERMETIIDQYDKDSIWYQRDILGKRCIAEGLIYAKIAASIAANDNRFFISKHTAIEMANSNRFIKISIGVDFGGNGSGHAFVACAETLGYQKLIVLRSERYIEGGIDPESGRKLKDIDPTMLSELFLRFVRRIIKDYGFVTKIYVDSEEQVLRRGFQDILNKNMLGELRVSNAKKGSILNRIRATSALIAQNRLQYTEDCQSFQEAVSQAVWKPDTIEWERLDDGTSDIDTLDAFEYGWERDINYLVRDTKEALP